MLPCLCGALRDIDGKGTVQELELWKSLSFFSFFFLTLFCSGALQLLRPLYSARLSVRITRL